MSAIDDEGRLKSSSSMLLHVVERRKSLSWTKNSARQDREMATAYPTSNGNNAEANCAGTEPQAYMCQMGNSFETWGG